MYITKKRLIYLLMTIIVFIPFIFAQEQEKLVEEVDVVNVMVPVRVFYKNEPVKGLKKDDFKLYVMGKETPIHGFFEKTKKIAAEQSIDQAHVITREPRLFVLIFSINNYNINLEQNLDILFQKIIRPNDRLIVVSNNYFLKDRVVKDMEKEKKRLIHILEVEIKRVRHDLQRIEFDLKTLVEDTVTMADGGMPVTVVKDFCSRYLNIFSDYKARYANLKKTQSLEMASYLEKQDIKKWVIYFHQIGMFPQLKPEYDGRGGPLPKVFADWSRANPWVRAELSRLQSELVSADGHMVKEISEYFLNTEVTFHTLLMKGINTVFLDYLDYKPIATNFESFIRKVTDLTGGETVSSTNIEKFVNKIVEKEDVYYVLTYVPPAKSIKDKAKIKVTVNDQRYQVIYDEQQRPGYMKKMLKKIDREENPQIRINQLSYKNRVLAVSISGIKIGIIDNENRGKIYLKIRILNDQSEVLSKVEKAFLCKKEKFVLRVKPPLVSEGNHDIVVEVDDLLTGKNDVAIKEVKIARDK
jgi:hypothetical protein